jgi:hypothetical protein
MAVGKMTKLLGGVSSVGFIVRATKSGAQFKEPNQFVLRWIAPHPELNAQLEGTSSSATQLASHVADLIKQNYCHTHALVALMMVNFSCISKATTVPDLHGLDR